MPPLMVAPKVTLNGSPLADRWLQQLTSLRVDRALNTVGRTTLRFLDPGFALSAAGQFALGTAIEVSIPGVSTKLFKGTVTGVNLEQSTEHVPELAVVADDGSWKLAMSTTSKAYLNQSYSSILSPMVSAAGLSASISMPSSTTHDYLLQTGTDLDFINQVTARTGTTWWVSTDGTLHVDKVGETTASIPLELGSSLVRFSVRASALNPDTFEVAGWSAKDQTTIVGNSDTATTNESSFVSSYPGRGASTGTVAVAELAPLDQSEAKEMASSLRAASTSQAVTAKGTCLVHAVVGPMTTVHVTGAGPASGDYVVSAVEHVYDRRGFYSHFTCGSHRPSGLVDLLGSTAPDAGFTMDGVVVGVVSDVADPDTQGRVKVKYGTASGSLESHWARIVTLGAGAKRGVVFQPEVKDEVLVAFERGDTRRPVVLGGLFSSQKGLPTSDNLAGSEVAFRRITSRLGHVIELGDGSAQTDQHLKLVLKDTGQVFRLGADKTELTATGKDITIGNGQASITLKSSGDIEVKGMSISLKTTGPNGVAIEGMKIEGKAQTQLNLSGAMVAMKGQATAEVSSTGPLTLKGMPAQIN